MAEPEGTAEVESPANDPAAASRALRGGEDAVVELDGADAVEDGADALGADGNPEDAETSGDEGEGEKKPEPPRRRLVAELLEGQGIVDDPASSGVQLVAPPLHLEPVDAGQPIYQLDLSSEEPEGVLVEPEPYAFSPESTFETAAAGAEGGALHVIKQMIVHRDRRVMAAERDGIGAYELAVGLDEFVRILVEAIRRVDV